MREDQFTRLLCLIKYSSAVNARAHNEDLDRFEEKLEEKEKV